MPLGNLEKYTIVSAGAGKVCRENLNKDMFLAVQNETCDVYVDTLLMVSICVIKSDLWYGHPTMWTSGLNFQPML